MATPYAGQRTAALATETQESPYVAQKRAALLAVPNYDYFIGPGYDLIPTDDFYAGYHMDDRSHESIYEGVHRPRNLPSNAQDLYRDYDTSKGLPGFHLWSPERQALDIAPILLERRIPQGDQLATSFAALGQLPTGDRWHNGLRTVDIGVVQRDAGNRIGVLFGPPTSRAAQHRGKILSVSPFSK